MDRFNPAPGLATASTLFFGKVTSRLEPPYQTKPAVLMGFPTRQAVRRADETTIYMGHNWVRSSWLAVKRNERQTTKNP